MAFSLQRIILFGMDIEQLKQFYQQYFQLEVKEEIPGEWVVLGGVHTELALHKIGQAWLNGDSSFRAESNTKLVFGVTDDLYRLRENWAAAGIAVQEVKSFPGIAALFCDGEDPEGNVFQLMQAVAS